MNNKDRILSNNTRLQGVSTQLDTLPVYENLDSELIFECSEGHKVYSSWKKIRNNKICPICKENNYKDPNSLIIKKASKEKRVLALDQATHISGWSVFDNGKLIKYGIFESTADSQVQRLFDIKNWRYPAIRARSLLHFIFCIATPFAQSNSILLNSCVFIHYTIEKTIFQAPEYNL